MWGSLACILCAVQLAAGPLAKLDALERSVDALEYRRNEIQSQRTELQEQLAMLTTDLAASRARQAVALTRFRRRLRVLAAMPSGARLAVLGGAHSLADYLEVTRVLRWVAREDRSLQERYIKETERLHELESGLAMRYHNLETIEAQQSREYERLTQDRRSRLDLLRQVSTRRELLAEAAQERERASAGLYRMVARMTPVGKKDALFGANRGRLPWPAGGPITTRFGLQTDETHGTVMMSNGIVIRAPAGTTVQAIADGTVVFADWLTAYGQIVIIQHGEGYHTLMAHLGTLAVHAGDAVTVGAPVGTVGESGSLEGPELYFEIRQGATPVDPEVWLQR
jgi:septal ring factor EnvC (AmiA/AmiB activator)